MFYRGENRPLNANTTVSPESLCPFAKSLLLASTDFYMEP